MTILGSLSTLGNMSSMSAKKSTSFGSSFGGSSLQSSNNIACGTCGGHGGSGSLIDLNLNIDINLDLNLVLGVVTGVTGGRGGCY